MTTKLETLTRAMIDLTQSPDPHTARRARSALFDAGILHDDWDGGVSESRRLYMDQKDMILPA